MNKQQSENISNIPSYFYVKGSIPYWDQERAIASFKNNALNLDYINLFWFYLNDDGTIKTYQYAKVDQAIIENAHNQGIKALAVLTNLPDQEDLSWDSKRVELVIQDPNARAKHIQDILDLIKKFNFDGIEIDYEQVNASQKDNFTAFIHELSVAMHNEEKIVVVDLHAKTGNPQKDSNIGDFQDWEGIAKAADQLNIMAFEEHWDESPPGPVASLPWVKSIISYTQSLDIPPEKVFLGIPLYGLLWQEQSEDPATSLTYLDVEKVIQEKQLTQQWHNNAQSPYFRYTENSINYEAWFENALSVKPKILLARQAKFGGITLWRLGGEDPAVWTVINQMTNNN